VEVGRKKRKKRMTTTCRRKKRGSTDYTYPLSFGSSYKRKGGGSLGEKGRGSLTLLWPKEGKKGNFQCSPAAGGEKGTQDQKREKGGPAYFPL